MSIAIKNLLCSQLYVIFDTKCRKLINSYDIRTLLKHRLPEHIFFNTFVIRLNDIKLQH